MCTNVGSDIPLQFSEVWHFLFLPSKAASEAVGVGIDREYPNPVAAVRCANVVRSNNIPYRIIPDFGKVSEDGGKSSSNKHR